jgi:hypothetical protein
MIDNYLFKAGLIISIGFLGFLNPLLSQVPSPDIIYGGIEDAEVILQDYLEPYAHILGSDLNAGWYNTARPHKLGGFDITAAVSWAKAPPSALYYDLAKLDLNGTLESDQGTTAPTVAGEQDPRPVLSYSQIVDLGGGNMQEVEYARFMVPDGAGVDFFPLPMAQLSVGMPLGTDVSVRFVPTVGYKDYGEIGLWGVGGKHSISQWLPLLKELEFLDISIQGGYTKAISSVNVLIEPHSLTEIDPYPDQNWVDQRITMEVEGWTLNLIASQTLPVVTFYQGIGYASSMVNLLMEGHYPVNMIILDQNSPEFGRVSYEIVEDPIDLSYKNFNNLRLNVGARVKLGVLTLHYDFTYTMYVTHSVGMGISFR